MKISQKSSFTNICCSRNTSFNQNLKKESSISKRNSCIKIIYTSCDSAKTLVLDLTKTILKLVIHSLLSVWNFIRKMENSIAFHIQNIVLLLCTFRNFCCYAHAVVDFAFLLIISVLVNFVASIRLWS